MILFGNKCFVLVTKSDIFSNHLKFSKVQNEIKVQGVAIKLPWNSTVEIVETVTFWNSKIVSNFWGKF